MATDAEKEAFHEVLLTLLTSHESEVRTTGRVMATPFFDDLINWVNGEFHRDTHLLEIIDSVTNVVACCVKHAIEHVDDELMGEDEFMHEANAMAVARFAAVMKGKVRNETVN